MTSSNTSSTELNLSIWRFSGAYTVLYLKDPPKGKFGKFEIDSVGLKTSFLNVLLASKYSTSIHCIVSSNGPHSMLTPSPVRLIDLYNLLSVLAMVSTLSGDHWMKLCS